METKHTQGKWVVSTNKLTEGKEVFVQIENKAAIALLFQDNSTVNNREENSIIRFIDNAIKKATE